MKSIEALQKAYEKRMAIRHNKPKMPNIWLGRVRDEGTAASDDFRWEKIPKSKMKQNRPKNKNHKQVLWKEG